MDMLLKSAPSSGSVMTLLPVATGQVEAETEGKGG
jgi:hypothetical protein